MAQIVGPTTHFNARGSEIYEIRVDHPGLGASHLIRSSDYATAISRARDKAALLDQRYERQTQLQRAGRNAFLAQELTAEAEARVGAIDALLQNGLKKPVFSWSFFKDQSEFTTPQPGVPVMPQEPQPSLLPPEPYVDAFVPKKTFINMIVPGSWRKVLHGAQLEFDHAYAEWSQARNKVLDDDNVGRAAWSKRCEEIAAQHATDVVAWRKQRADHRDSQHEQHRRVEQLQKDYGDGAAQAVRIFVDAVISYIGLPDCFPSIHEAVFDPASGMLVLDLWLPPPSELPDVKEFKYVKSRDEIDEKKLPASRSSALFEDLGYQTALLVPHAIFAADEARTILAITFNGRVIATDASTGRDVDACILSLQAKREELDAINLAAVEPKACFKKLKGVAASKLHSVTPVAPLLSFAKDDHRFTRAYEVAGTLEEGENLAAMDWEDFEHLIREMFEAEFKTPGAEVRVTRASRDGGVDAVIFDPDPLRGGKIVVQAKRYTNTVGPSAVRDLFGAVQHEGANKGIIVTTASFGPDAYEFAKGKPLVLIDGGGLLALLERHGHRVRINLAEAKALG